jgi:hypothetical protein
MLGGLGHLKKKVTEGSYTMVQLDRGLASPSWSVLYPHAVIKQETAATSDHGPILLEFEEAMQATAQLPFQFCYELM